MPPQETDHLLANGATSATAATTTTTPRPATLPEHLSFGVDGDDCETTQCCGSRTLSKYIDRSSCRGTVTVPRSGLWVCAIGLGLLLTLTLRLDRLWRTSAGVGTGSTGSHASPWATMQDLLYTPPSHTGPYRLTERHVGHEFMHFYDFYGGADSVGSAGYNTYVSQDDATALGLINVTTTTKNSASDHTGSDEDEGISVYLSSAPTPEGPRQSIRLEGKTRFDAGLFILDLDHMPAGCGQWPAFWLTDETDWPAHGEIDVVEGVNHQDRAKTALHTTESCSMFAHVPDYAKTGVWDRSTGLYDTYTGVPDTNTSVPADNCWAQAPHQWSNQGCVLEATEEATLGAGLNRNSGGVYALQWDPVNRYIRSWVFPKSQGMPANLQAALKSTETARTNFVAPDPDDWGLPYGYFAIGDSTGCPAHHFQNMRLVFNTAFCGTVAGNRFFQDCPGPAQSFNVSNDDGSPDPMASCNAYIASEPDELDEAYWKIRGVYVYERSR